MNNNVEHVIKLLCEAFNKNFDDFQGIYLYGVFTDGKVHKNKDIELVAIFDVENKHKREIIWPIVGKIETELDVFIDLHPITMEDFKKDEDFYNEVISDGIFYNTEGKRA